VTPKFPIVDAHLDLAWNAANGRDLRRAAADIRAEENKTENRCMVTFPEMVRGGIALVFGSIFVMKGVMEGTDHDFDEEIAARARQQIDIYRGFEDEGLVRIVRSRSSLEDHLAMWERDGLPGLLVAMEGAEPIRSPDELEWWFDAGLRMIGPAWGPTRYCGGFAGSRGVAKGFTQIGRELVDGMKALSIPLDLAHSSVELYWEGVESDHPHVCCTHTAPREVLGIDRMPDAEQMSALAKRGGVIGLGLGNIFLTPSAWGEERGRADVPLSTVGDVFGVMASAAGWGHVGIGSDLDGGIGVDESPDSLESIADEPKLADVLPADVRDDVLGGNWLRFLRSALPN
jgi:membrane dipeptidase